MIIPALFAKGGKWCSGDPLRSLCLLSSRLEEIVDLGIPLRSLWPTLRCRRVAGVSPLLSIGWWYLSSVSPKRHCCRVSAADKGRWVYPLDPRPDTVVLYSGCTSGKRRAWYLPDDRHTASLVGLRGGWRHSRMKTISIFMDPEILCPGNGLVLPNINIDTIATNSRFLIVSLPNHEMPRKSPFAIQKALKGIGGDPKSVKKLRSGDLLIETVSALQTKSFLSANLLQPASSNSEQNKTTPIPTVSTSSSSTQAHLLRSTSTISNSQPPIPKIPISNDLPSNTIPSTSAILPTIQKEALLPIPILTSTTTSSAGNSLNTSSSSLKTNTRLFPTTSNKFVALSTEIQPSVSLSESEATASNNEPSNTFNISKRLKRNSKNRKRRAKEQKAEIEVKMTNHTPKNSYIHYDSEEEDMIIYNVDEILMDDHVRTATAGSDIVQSGRPIFNDFFQHLWPFIGNNTANVVFQMVKRLWLIRIDQ
ncbi:uncharacterized protein TNCV_4799971 [Trichonephila clavipes]|uniref:Uncharacterized protein n=1 Tax=Trichonephila clavipes TaxID=2585209 RepID=A0A8X6RID3_TRICX|nr:uncharacterized protein TNCV_4799971 [Trichonephila clavipes]